MLLNLKMLELTVDDLKQQADDLNPLARQQAMAFMQMAVQ